jgi:hypothetical protein
VSGGLEIGDVNYKSIIPINSAGIVISIIQGTSYLLVSVGLASHIDSQLFIIPKKFRNCISGPLIGITLDSSLSKHRYFEKF